MNLDDYWSIIEDCRNSSDDDQERMADAIRERLRNLSPDEVQQFDQHTRQLIDDAYTWDLWAAAYIMEGGCSDDGFEYFRLWLIAQGRAIHEQALRDPESLANVKRTVLADGEYAEFETLLYLPAEIYEELTGSELTLPPRDLEREPRGERWEEEEVEVRLPRLFEAFKEVWES